METYFKILKLGLPGLVFLLSFFTYNLLRREQARDRIRDNILSHIKLFMYLNVLFAFLTFAGPLIEQYLLRPVEAGQSVMIDKILLLQEPASGMKITKLAMKHPPTYSSDNPRILFLAVVSGYQITKNARCKLNMEIIIHNPKAKWAQFERYSERQNPNEWRDRLKALKIPLAELEKLAGDLKERTVFMGIIDNIGAMKKGQYKLRFIVKDDLAGRSAESGQNIEII